MKSSFQGKRALLIGNGINQLDREQSVSWGMLLDQLRRDFGIEVDLNNAFKPFPLGFEEMLHRKGGNNDFLFQLHNLKRSIRENIDEQLEGKPGFNDYHKRVMECGFDDVLTTNYDYALQKSVMFDFLERKAELAQNKRESKFSMRRSYVLSESDPRIWHIHGELYDSRNLAPDSKFYHEESIMIGYEHYASYLERIQENFKGNRGAQKAENQGLITRVRNGASNLFWTDIFFTHNVDIVGQGLDYSENHLWWLLNQRANIMRTFDEKLGITIDNKIRFFYPVIAEKEVISETNINAIIKKRNAIEKARGIGEVLEAFKVIPKPIECASYEDFYDKLLERELDRTKS